MKSFVIIAALCGFLLSSAFAAENPVAMHTGAFTHNIDLSAPKHLGIHPRLSLEYSSATGMGNVAYGWNITLPSGIYRLSSKGRGPTYTASDKFYLGSEELVPSIELGGTHRLKYDSSFSRIELTNQEWRITHKNGVREIYRPVLGKDRHGVYWELAEVIHPRGPKATYHYELLGNRVRVLKEIRYGGPSNDYYKVTLNYKGSTKTRLVATQVNGNSVVNLEPQFLIQSVVFTYRGRSITGIQFRTTPDALTGFELLTEVQEYGSDLVVSNGAIVGGSSLPAVKFSYTQTNNLELNRVKLPHHIGDGFYSRNLKNEDDENPHGEVWILSPTVQAGSFIYADLDSDGMADAYACSYPDRRTERENKFLRVRSVRLNKNGQWLAADHLCPENSESFAKTLSRSSECFRVNIVSPTGFTEWAGDFILGDINGDNFADIINRPRTYSDRGALNYFALGGANGFTETHSLQTSIPNKMPAGFSNGLSIDRIKLIDLNGDGRDDLIANFEYRTLFREPSNPEELPKSVRQQGSVRYALLSTGSSWEEAPQYNLDNQEWTNTASGGATVLFLDLNNDGLPDVLHNYYDNGVWHSSAKINTGSGWRNADHFKLPHPRLATAMKRPDGLVYGKTFETPDLNGDGLPDLIIKNIDTPGSWWGDGGVFNEAYLNAGSGWVHAPQFRLPDAGPERLAFTSVTHGKQDASVFSTGGSIEWGDFNADGLPDIACYVYNGGNAQFFTNTSTFRQVWLNTGSGWRAAPEHVIADPLLLTAAITINNKVLPNTADFFDLDGNGSTDQTYNIKVTERVSCMPGVSTGYHNGRYMSQIAAPLLRTITHMHGAVTEVQYERLSQVANRIDMRTNPFVTTRVAFKNRVGQVVDGYTYNYYNAKYDRATKRYLGFEESAVYSDLGPLQRYKFDHSPHLAPGTIRETWSGYTENNREIYLNCTKKAYKVDMFSPYSIQPEVIHEIEYSHNASRERVSNVEYDIYGNATEMIYYPDRDSGVGAFRKEMKYSYNGQKYIVNVPSEEMVFSDVSGGELLRHSRGTVNEFGEITRTEEFMGEEGWATTSFEYSPNGLHTRITDANGSQTRYEYDSELGVYPVRIINSLGHVTSTSYDYLHGLPVRTVDPNGNVTEHRVDVFGRTNNSTTSGKNFARVSYPNWSSSTSELITPNGGYVTNSINVDEFGRTVQEHGSLGVKTYSYLGAKNLLVSESLPSANLTEAGQRLTTYNYDRALRRISQRLPSGETVTVRYGLGETTVIDPFGKETTTYTDMTGRVMRVVERAGGQTKVTRYMYDQLGRLLVRVNPLGQMTVNTYKFGRLVSTQDPDRGTVRFTLDRMDRLIAQTDARNITQHYTYDALARITSKRADNGETYRIEYDGAENGIGQPSKITYPNGDSRTILRYSEYGKPSHVRYNYRGLVQNEVITYHQDGSVNTYSISDLTLRYSYNSKGQIDRIEGSRQGKNFVYAHSFIYSPTGELREFTYGNGVKYTAQYDPRLNGQTLSFAYSLNSANIMRCELQYLRSALISNIRESFSASGDLASASRESNFSHDPWGQLVAETHTGEGSASRSYEYDLLGNILSKSDVGRYTYDQTVPMNAPKTVGGRSLRYDSTGNTLAHGDRLFRYDSFHNLVETRINADAVHSFYDEEGKRYRVISHLASAPRTYGRAIIEDVTHFGDVLSIRHEGDTARTIFNVKAGNRVIAKHELTQSGQDVVTYFHHDHLGNLRLTTDQEGRVQTRQHYTAFGELSTNRINWDTREKVGFTGHQTDFATDLVYMGSRYYDPKLARFLAPDAIDTDAGTDSRFQNPYAYVNNCPTVATDPDGHFWNLIIAAIQAVVNWINTGHFAFEFSTNIATIEWGGAPPGTGDGFSHLTLPGTYYLGINALGEYEIDNGFVDFHYGKDTDIEFVFDPSRDTKVAGILPPLSPGLGIARGNLLSAKEDLREIQEMLDFFHGSGLAEAFYMGTMDNQLGRSLVNAYIASGGRLAAYNYRRTYKVFDKAKAEASVKFTFGFNGFTMVRKQNGVHLRANFRGLEVVIEGKWSKYGIKLGDFKASAVIFIGRGGGNVGGYFSFPMINGVPTLKGSKIVFNGNIGVSGSVRGIEVQSGKGAEQKKATLGELGLSYRILSVSSEYGWRVDAFRGDSIGFNGSLWIYEQTLAEKGKRKDTKVWNPWSFGRSFFEY